VESRSSLGIAPGVSFSTASGARFHYATASDIELMKETIGVRDPERDYNIIQGQFGTGLAPPTEEAWDSMIGSSLILESLPQGPSAPASYDLSTQPYFPAVGNQGGQGSCGAWAATYYCYGYTEAKDQGWTDAKTGNTAHLVSPAWTYNRVNGGVDHGSWMDENMNIIVDWGVPSMQAMPYNDHDLLNWGSPAAFREAPLHRALSTVAIPYYGDTTINQIKDLVSSDKPVTFAFNADGFSGLNDGDGIISALEYPATDINHAQTIVGYNDSISEDGDVGAFRVVNSWGTSDGYTDHGYYWFTYNALKEIGDAAGLCYIEDRVDYNPRLLAVWHFNAQPSRSNYFTVGIGNPSAPAGERSPLFSGDSNSAHRQPVFMCLDITDFNSTYNLGTNSFFLKYLATSVSGVISSFRVEMYEPSYISGAATQISPQSSNVPRTTPDTVTVSFPYHAQIAYDEGLDTSGHTYTSTSLSKWVGVDHRSIYGGDALQSGDTANSDESSISTAVTGPGAVGFYWRVSSEASKDYLNVYLDGIKQASISGSVDWRQQVVALTAGAHTIRWSYAKDSATSVGEDAGYVDRLRMLPPDDGYEENDVYSTAKMLSPGTYPGLVCYDDDWFKVHVVPGRVICANISFVAGDGNLDLFLYDIDGATLLDSSQGTSGLETVSSSVLVEGDYYVLIRGVNADTNTYSLSVQTTLDNIDLGEVSSLSLFSGSGSFSGLGASDKDMTVNAGTHLTGTVVLKYKNYWPGASNIPLIGTTSWGSHSSSYWTASADLPDGSSQLTVSIDVTVPATAGNFYLIFAFRNESSGAYIASATSSSGSPVWNDGNDIASFSSAQVTDAQADGRAEVSWLFGSSGRSLFVPSEAIKIISRIPDNTPPVTEVQLAGTAGNGGWFKSSVTVTLTASDVGNGVQYTKYRIDSGGWQTYSVPFAISSEGTSTVYYYSVDYDSNTETTKEVEVKVDRIEPTTLMTIYGMKGLGDWYVSEVEVNLTASDTPSGVASINCRVDGGPWQPYSSNIAIGEEGEHTVEWNAIDVAGNAEDVNSLSLRIDLAAPQSTATPTGDGQGGWFNRTVDVTLQSTDTQSGVNFTRYRIDNGSWLTYSLPFDVSGDGGHEVEFYAVDMAGNSASHLNLTFWIDATPPTLSLGLLGSIGDQGWMISSASFTMSASDLTSGLAHSFVSIDNGTWFEYSEGLTVSSDGPHSIRCYAVDVAGNPSSVEEMDFKLDLTLPATAFTLEGVAGNNSWYLSEVNVTLVPSDSMSGVLRCQYSLDSGIWSDVSGTILLRDEGSHTLRFRSDDRAGNQESVQSLSIKIDTQAPTSSALASGSEGLAGWYVSAVVLQLQSADLTSGLVNIAYSLDGGALANYSQPLTVASPGEHTMNYYAQDQAGNLEATRSISFRIDTGKPQSSNTLTGPMGSEQWYLGEVSINLSASDPVSGVLQLDYRVDGGEWLTFLSVVGVTSEGDHELEYRAVDRAGNVETTHALSFRIDSSAPSLELSVDNAKHSTSGSLRVAWTSADQVSSLLQVEVSVDGKEYAVVAPDEKDLEIKNLGDGKHTVSLRSTDVAGNSAIASYEITVDTNPLSPDGPLGPWLLVTLGALAVAAVGLVLWHRRK